LRTAASAYTPPVQQAPPLFAVRTSGRHAPAPAVSTVPTSQLRENLARVEAALARWEAFDVEAARPPDQRKGIEPPVVTRETLRELLATLLEELARRTRAQ
jgi:hypothetical protein